MRSLIPNQPVVYDPAVAGRADEKRVRSGSGTANLEPSGGSQGGVSRRSRRRVRRSTLLRRSAVHATELAHERCRKELEHGWLVQSGKAESLGLLAAVFAGGPSFAQSNFAGVWAPNLFEDFPDRLPGPELGDYAGLPLNAADRLRAESWSATILSLPDYQCRVHPSDYANSFAQIRMWEEINTTTQELIAIHLQHFAWSTQRTFWMDGRPHPPTSLSTRRWASRPANGSATCSR